MAYTVINRFRDADGHVYEVGETYPLDGLESTEARLEELSKVHPKYKRVFIEQAEEQKSLTEEEEKEAIKAELESLGVSFHPNTGLEKLKEKLEEARANSEKKE